jgi:hypothetical protein
VWGVPLVSAAPRVLVSLWRPHAAAAGYGGPACWFGTGWDCLALAACPRSSSPMRQCEGPVSRTKSAAARCERVSCRPGGPIWMVSSCLPFQEPLKLPQVFLDVAGKKKMQFRRGFRGEVIERIASGVLGPRKRRRQAPDFITFWPGPGPLTRRLTIPISQLRKWNCARHAGT